MRAALLLVLLAGCDPVWGVDVHLQHPGQTPVENATVAVACEDTAYGGMAIRTRADGKAWVGGMGTVFPVGCDVYVAKPGFVTQRIRYRDLCPNGPTGCDRNFHFELVMQPVQQVGYRVN